CRVVPVSAEIYLARGLRIACRTAREIERKWRLLVDRADGSQARELDHLRVFVTIPFAVERNEFLADMVDRERPAERHGDFVGLADVAKIGGKARTARVNRKVVGCQASFCLSRQRFEDSTAVGLVKTVELHAEILDGVE